VGSFLVATGATHFFRALLHALLFLGRGTTLFCAVSSGTLGHDEAWLWPSLALRPSQQPH